MCGWGFTRLAMLGAMLVLTGGEAMGKQIQEVDGVRMIHVENADAGMVNVDVILEAGSWHDPAGKEGLANLTASMLLRGTRTRTYQQIMDAVNDLGATIDTEARKEFMAVSLDVMPRHLDAVVAILADILAASTFPDGEFKKERDLALEDLKNLRDDDEGLARYYFGRFLYQGHPLGRPTMGLLTTLRALKADDCRTYYRAHARKGNVIVALSGAIDEVAARRIVIAVTKGISAGAREDVPVPPPPRNHGVRVLVVDKSDRTQTQVMMGHPSLSWIDPDHVALSVGNTAFGGTFTSRLTREIREKRGWSYGAGSMITSGRTFGTLAIRFFPSVKDTAPAVALALDLMRDAATKGLHDDEVAFARNHMANQFPFRFETERKRSEEILANEVFGRPEDFLDRFVERVRAETPASVNRALRRWLWPDDAVVVVVGPAQQLVPALTKIPGVTNVQTVPYDTDTLSDTGLSKNSN